jgi:O-antigen ligase
MGGVRWLSYHLLSLETFLVFFLYASHLKALLPSTPLPETVFYGGMTVVIGGWIMLREGIYRGGIPIVIAGFVLSGWMFISYSWSPSIALARESLPFIIGINLWALFVAACVVAGSRERVIRFLLLLMLLAAVLGAIGSYINLVHGDFRFYRGAYGDWHHRTYLAWGNITMTGAAVALALALNTRLGSVKQLAAMATFLCCLYFLMINGARGGLLGMLLAGIVAFAATPPQIRDGRVVLARAQLLALVLAIAIVLYFSYLITTGETTTTLNRFLKLLDQAEDPLLRIGANRFDYFAGAYRAWLDSPFIGQGLNGFSIFFCGLDQEGCHPHNIFLQILADQGLIGGILLVVFIGLGLKIFNFAELRNDALQRTVLMAFATILVYVMVAADLSTAHRFFFFVGLLAMRSPHNETDKGGWKSSHYGGVKSSH